MIRDDQREERERGRMNEMRKEGNIIILHFTLIIYLSFLQIAFLIFLNDLIDLFLSFIDFFVYIINNFLGYYNMDDFSDNDQSDQ